MKVWQLILKQLDIGADRFRIIIKSDEFLKDKELERLLAFGRQISSCWMIDRTVIFLQADMKEVSEIRLYGRGDIENVWEKIKMLFDDAEQWRTYDENKLRQKVEEDIRRVLFNKPTQENEAEL